MGNEPESGSEVRWREASGRGCLKAAFGESPKPFESFVVKKEICRVDLARFIREGAIDHDERF